MTTAKEDAIGRDNSEPVPPRETRGKFGESLMRAVLAIFLSLIPAQVVASGIDMAVACAQTGDYACAFETFLESAASEEVGAGDIANGDVGQAFETSFMGYAASLPAQEKRDLAEATISLLDAKSVPADKLRTAPHLVRVEACNAVQDYDCALDSVAFICMNKDDLYLPAVPDGQKDGLLGRVVRILDLCEKAQ